MFCMDLFLDRDGINELKMGLQPALRSLGGFAAPFFVCGAAHARSGVVSGTLEWYSILG